MQTTIEETDKHKVKLTVEVAPEDYQKDLDKAYREIANSVRIPGFRKGKAPKKVIDAQVGADVVFQEFLRDSLYDYYMGAIREHDLAPITDPDIDLDDDAGPGKPLSFTAEVEVRPRLALSEADYMGVRVERPVVEVTDEEIDDYIERLRDRMAELEVVERPAIDGDYAVIDIRGTEGDEEIAEATQSDFLYEVGTGLLEPRLDEELRGKKKGDIISFEHTLPEGFGDVAGKEVSFTVLVKEVKGKKLPEADDAFAKEASEFDTIEELREDLRTKISEAKGREADAAVRERALQVMVDATEVDLPERLIDEETDRRIEGAKERYARLGVTLEDALEQQGWDEARFREDARDHAVRAIKADLILESVSRAEDLQVTPEELASEIGNVAAALGRDTKSTAKALNETGQVVTLAGDIIRSKALDLVVENAEIVAEEPSDEGEAEESEEESQ
jgi:trigger factor